MKKLLIAGACAAAFLGIVTQHANAVAITSSTTLEVDWDLGLGSGPDAGIDNKARAVFSNFVFGLSSVQFDLTVTNTTTGATGSQDARLVSFGWDTAPLTSALTDNTQAVFTEIAGPGLHLPGDNNIEVCLYAGPNCDGGSNQGLEDPNHTNSHNLPTTVTDHFTVNFGGATVPPLAFTGFYAKFQDGNSYEGFDSTECVNGTCVPSQQDVPEPGSLALLGLGVVGLGYVTTRRRFRTSGTQRAA
jgi:hypothetical protein